MSEVRIAFAGDRDISVWVLNYLLEQQVKPLALMVSNTKSATHTDELIDLCSFLDKQYILRGRQFREPASLELLQQLDLDYIIGIHFPYIVPEDVLALPRVGVINLHPAYLPYNRGWHTPTWSLLEGHPAGATLHFMDAGIDTGDIIHQKQLEVSPGETANTLYQRLKQLELEVFQEAWEHLRAGTYQRYPQSPDEGTSHNKKDLDERFQKLDLDEQMPVRDLLLRLRALTTNRVDEAAYYEVDGKRYRVQVMIHEDSETPANPDQPLSETVSSVIAQSSR